jgi:hypothetical protein
MVLMGLELPTVELPGAAGSGQACAAAMQQLTQLQGRLQQDLQAARWALSEFRVGSSSSSCSNASNTSEPAAVAVSSLPADVAAALPGLAQQMVVFGQALCAQFPLPYCCNNPGCTELRGASELQLVGGKGCVCARCRWVMICVACWLATAAESWSAM